MYFVCFRAECHELMLQLKATVEGLLALPSVNVWNIHGGLERLDRCIRHILKHRIKASSVSNLYCVSFQSLALFWSFLANFWYTLTTIKINHILELKVFYRT